MEPFDLFLIFYCCMWLVTAVVLFFFGRGDFGSVVVGIILGFFWPIVLTSILREIVVDRIFSDT